MYSVICDRCGRILEDGAFWEDESSAIMYALNSKWVEIGEKHYCPDCYEFDDELDEYVPKKKGVMLELNNATEDLINGFLI